MAFYDTYAIATMKIFQALVLAGVAVLQVDAETCNADWSATCSDATTTVATTTDDCTGTAAACTEDDCCYTKCLSHTCTVTDEVQIQDAATTACTDDTCTDAQCCEADTKCLSHTCTVTDEVQIQDAATTACTDDTCTDAQCCEAEACSVATACGDNQDCTAEDDNTATCTCMDGYIDDNADGDAATVVCDLDAAATTDCAEGGCADADCCIADPCAVDDVCGDNQDCAVADDNTASCTCMDGYVDDNADGDAATVVCEMDGDDDEDICPTEMAACEANTACAACMTAGDAYMEDETCVVESELETCQDYADMYCCYAGGEDGEDECRTNSLMLAYTNCMVEEYEVESCTLIDLCDASATVAPTPAPVTSGTSSFFSRSSPGTAVFGAVATGIAGFLFTAVEGLL
ncbi:expressed unknown protein [Ectocarpus siliculosus]|uniref:EGF-like domain-containing protein n=1 Tax=Ectocarpus siliculosus TaxID=2880 RepID=D8LMC6_ECTSI|nr:expressed unknown protein [Ectocarpus siliculosus]|eukprot:CBN77536.1 expressed unknown protein [Ectocarpus siliculosus]